MITGGSWLQSSRKEKTFLVGRSFFIGKNKGSVKVVESVCGEPVLYESVEKLVGKVVGKLWERCFGFSTIYQYFVHSLSMLECRLSIYPCFDNNL